MGIVAKVLDFWGSLFWKKKVVEKPDGVSWQGVNLESGRTYDLKMHKPWMAEQLWRAAGKRLPIVTDNLTVLSVSFCEDFVTVRVKVH